MDCPICQKPMIVLELDQVEVDHCLTCGGVWLDAEEMDLLLSESAGGGDIRSHMKPDTTTTEKKRECPICSKKMEKLRIHRDGHDASVLIDRCKRGHGTWLDGGELEQIVQLSEFPAAHHIHRFLTAVFRDPGSGVPD